MAWKQKDYTFFLESLFILCVYSFVIIQFCLLLPDETYYQGERLKAETLRALELQNKLSATTGVVEQVSHETERRRNKIYSKLRYTYKFSIGPNSYSGQVYSTFSDKDQETVEKKQGIVKRGDGVEIIYNPAAPEENMPILWAEKMMDRNMNTRTSIFILFMMPTCLFAAFFISVYRSWKKAT